MARVDPNNLPPPPPRSTKRVPRDVRADRIGFANLLAGWNERQKDELKADLLADGYDLARGDFFRALLVKQPQSSFDADALLRLYEKGHLTRKQLVAAIWVKPDAAKEILAPEVLEKLRIPRPERVAMRIEPLQQAPLSLVEALAALAPAVGRKTENGRRKTGSKP